MRVQVSLTCADPESGLRVFDYAILDGSYGSGSVPLQSARTRYGTWPRRISRSGLALELGHAYHFHVKLENFAQQVMEYQTEGVTIDQTPPLYGRVLDGPDPSGDWAWQWSNGSLTVTWMDFLSVNSPISRCG